MMVFVVVIKILKFGMNRKSLKTQVIIVNFEIASLDLVFIKLKKERTKRNKVLLSRKSTNDECGTDNHR